MKRWERKKRSRWVIIIFSDFTWKQQKYAITVNPSPHHISLIDKWKRIRIKQERYLFASILYSINCDKLLLFLMWEKKGEGAPIREEGSKISC